MNVFFNRFSAHYAALVKLNLIKELGIKRCVSVDGLAGFIDPAEAKKLGCDYSQYEFWEANHLLIKNIDWNKIPPVDEKIASAMLLAESDVVRLYEKESNIYTFSNKDIIPKDELETIEDFTPQRFLQGFLVGMPHDDRKRNYYNHLRYWNYVLDSNKINLIVFSLSPHFIYEYIIYRLAELKGIPVYWSYHSAIIGSCGIYKSLKDYGAEAAGKKMEELKKQYTYDEITFEREEFDIEWRRLCQDYRVQEKPVGGDLVIWDDLNKKAAERFAKDNALNDKGKQRGKYKGKKWKLLLEQVKDPDYWHFKLKFKSLNNYRDKLIKYYESLCVRPDLSKNFIYLPLHMQPEDSNAPRAGMFAHQELIVDMLAYHIPDDWFIYIKEHPAQKYKHRSPQFYQHLLKNPKVKLVSTQYNTFELMEFCKAVATINGTAGYEGLYKGKPCLMFGYFFYNYAPGVFHIRTNEQCAEAIRKITSGEKVFDVKDLKYFLKAVEVCTFRGGLLAESVAFLDYDDETAARVMTDAFMNKFREDGVIASQAAAVNVN